MLASLLGNGMLLLGTK